jgi:hypothetical protein
MKIACILEMVEIDFLVVGISFGPSLIIAAIQLHWLDFACSQNR